MFSSCRTVSVFIHAPLSQCQVVSVGISCESTALTVFENYCWWAPHTGWLPFCRRTETVALPPAMMCGQVKEMLKAVVDLFTVAWENHLEKLNQEYSQLGSSFSCPGRGSRFRPQIHDFFFDHGVQDWMQHGGRILGRFLCRRRGYMRLSEGRTFAFFADSTFPTPPVQICEETKSPTGEGDWYLQSKPGGRSVRESSTLLSYPLPSPRAVGERSENSLELTRRRKKGNTFDPRGSTAFF